MLSIEQRLDPRRTALIVVDVQNDFCHPRGSCARYVGVNLADVEAAMPALHRLIAAARSAGVFVVFIQSIYDDQYLSPALRDQFERRNNRALCQAGSWGAEFYGGVGPEPERGEVVVVKHRYNAFAGTELDAVLRRQGIDNVVCCGFTTSCCVESTARDAFFHDYSTVLASDAMAEFDRDLHDATLRLFSRSFGPVLRVDEIAAAWERANADRSAAAASARS